MTEKNNFLKVLLFIVIFARILLLLLDNFFKSIIYQCGNTPNEVKIHNFQLFMYKKNMTFNNTQYIFYELYQTIKILLEINILAPINLNQY